jgi:hypothetical protein
MATTSRRTKASRRQGNNRTSEAARAPSEAKGADGPGGDAHRGVVRRADPKAAPRGADLDFGADYTVTSTDDDGGRVLTDVEVILCYWGSFWSTTPAPSPSSDEYTEAIQGILSGPFMGGLGQYRGVGQGTVIHTEINDASDPQDLYTDSDVVSMLKDRIDHHGMPGPTAGHNRFYAVIAPQGIRNGLTQFAGQHQSFSHNGATAYYAWVDNTGSLTGHDCTTKVFSHELVEACTNPDVDTSNDGILVQGKNSDGSTVTNDEIGDTCNNQFATVDMNGVTCSVQSYWSKADNACILPLGVTSFLVDKDTFGHDEVKDVIAASGGKFTKAFWVIVDGFSRDSFSALNASVPVPTGAFASIPGVAITQNPQVDFESGVPSDAQQRIRVGFDVTFSTASLSHFPTSGSQTYALNAVLATDGNPVGGSGSTAIFELVAGADPYFTNVDPSQGNVFYLSQDVRVFTATPGKNPTPVVGGPTFSSDSTAGAFDYIQKLLKWLNTTFSNPSGSDPFSTLLPGQTGALSGDSSVSPLTVDFTPPFNFQLFSNYNFAIARVRLRGSPGPAGAAKKVRVFFRLWSTQTADTDYDTVSTYPSTADPAGLPASPLVGVAHHTLPFFATGNVGTNSDYGSNGVNVRTITIPAGHDSIWAYFGCFINLYDQSNVIDGQPIQAWLNGTHHCLVAQIAYDGAPVVNGASPERSDKLAQRNLQVTLSDNPGPAAGHRIPQTFDIRPSAASNLTGVDELMIDWGGVPPGSTGSIYWPQVPAADVVALASQLYGRHGLTTAGSHTIRCEISDGVTYVPVMRGAGDNFAGLLTVDLPATVIAGQEFNVVVRRLAVRDTRQPSALNGKRAAADAARSTKGVRPWRYVVGTFQVRIPVATPATMLGPEEDALAIMRWRMHQMTASNRWHPVLTRYLELVADRVTALGGDPSKIAPSPEGAERGRRDRDDDVVRYRGSVAEVLFDCHGHVDGIVLVDCSKRHRFHTRESRIGDIALRAIRDGLIVTVTAPASDLDRIKGLAVGE